VRPHNKTWKKVNLLSGGEKTMTALALTFAFSRIRHCPFYLMDEIDAALDYRNTGILAKYIKNQQCSQMVVISLRRNMYEEAGCLTGVYKIDNCSRTLTVKATDLESIRQSAIESREDEK
jgi:structural maintenance of chromosome 4